MTEKFDPRFDPRYQPGYSGEESEFSEKAATSESSRPRPSPPPRTPDPVPGSEAAGAGSGADSAVESDGDTPVEQNPFELILWIMAAGLVIGGVAFAYWASSLNYMYVPDGAGWSWQQMLQSSGWALSGPMVTVGLATVVGLFFRRAMTWKPPES